jgi:ribosomal protein L40E
MEYCTECGTQVGGMGSYCPECGAKLEEQAESGEQPEPQDSEPIETAPCQKCDSEISVEADRCPECGYEPSPGILGGIIMWVAGGVGVLFGLTAIISLILIFDGLAVTTGLIGSVITGAIATVCFGLVYAGHHTRQRGPTEEPPLG